MILFNPDTIGVSKMERHRDMPASGERLLRRALGLHGTSVNGIRVFDGTGFVAHTSGPGEVLTRFNAGKPRLAMQCPGTPNVATWRDACAADAVLATSAGHGPFASPSRREARRRSSTSSKVRSSPIPALPPSS